MTTSSPHRLPRAAVPERYELELVPDVATATFTGTVAVAVRVDQALDHLVLNAADLSVVDARWTRGTDPARAATVEVDAGAERLVVGLGETVPAGSSLNLEMAFTGTLNDRLRGFYLSRFTDPDGTPAVIATTQFESTDARRAFPCWDEPDFKAVFALSLVVEEASTALSSSPVVGEEPVGEGRRRVRFGDTMVMPTYVLAWVIGPFELSRSVEVDGVELRIVAPRGRFGLTSFASEVGAHALRYLSAYFALPYPGDKLDHVAIPDFAFGAMENLGCITYRENALLVDPTKASRLELMRVAEVIAHETAHMWFGNLVTMRWWNGIWLNEAFATFMELKTTEAFRPEWEPWTAFGAGKAAALAIDGLTSTRPVEFEVGPPEEAEAMFDVLTYQKGGSVLRMLEQYLGEDTFRAGIARYLLEHRWSNTETTDLWDALEAVSGEPVRAVMDSWIFQGGHPLVSVALGPEATSLEISQTRFLYAGSAPEQWRVPVTLRASVGGQIVRRRLLLEEPTTLSFDGAVDWVVLNEGGWGFYRVRYSPDLLARLGSAGARGNALERLGLVGDTWASVLAGHAGLGDLLELLAGLGDETDPDVWAAMLGPMGLIDLIATEEDRPALAARVRALAGPAFASLGWDPVDGESERVAITRSRLIGALGTIGADPRLRAEASARHRRFLETGSGLSPDILTAAVGVLAAAGDPADYEVVLSRYRDAATPQDQVRYLQGLAGFSEPALARRTLELAVSDEVRNQDGPFLLAGVLAGRGGPATAWPWIEANLDRIVERFPRNLLVRVFEGLAGVVEAPFAEAVHRFLGEHPLPVGGPRVAQLLERMDINVALAARIRPTLGAVLEAAPGAP